MVLYPEQMKANLNKTRGMLFSSKVLLASVNTGITREEAYKIVPIKRHAGVERYPAGMDDLRSASALRPIRHVHSPKSSSIPFFDPWSFLRVEGSLSVLSALIWIKGVKFV